MRASVNDVIKVHELEMQVLKVTARHLRLARALNEWQKSKEAHSRLATVLTDMFHKLDALIRRLTLLADLEWQVRL